MAGGWVVLLRAPLQSCDPDFVLVQALGLAGDAVGEDSQIVAEAFGNHIKVPPGFVEMPAGFFRLSPELLVDLRKLPVDRYEPPVDRYESPVDFGELPTVSLVGPGRCHSDAQNLQFHRLEATIHQSFELGNSHWLF